MQGDIVSRVSKNEPITNCDQSRENQMNNSVSIIPAENIEKKIYTIRGFRVMLDSDLAELYEVPTKVLNQAVKRNPERFPDHYMFQLSWEEAGFLRSQIVTLKKDSSEESKRGKHVKYLPYVFTEHGVLQLSNVLKSDRAIKVSIQIVDAFVRLRKTLLTYADIAKKIEEIESRLAGHDDQFKVFQELILPLLGMNFNIKPKIGFDPENEK